MVPEQRHVFEWQHLQKSNGYKSTVYVVLIILSDHTFNIQWWNI